LAAEAGRAGGPGLPAIAHRRWATLAALLLLWMQLAWAALNDLRSVGLRVALVLAAWLVWERVAARPAGRPRRSAPLGRALAAAAAAVLAASLFVLYRLDVRPTSRALLAAALVAPLAYLAPVARRRLRRGRRWLRPVVVGGLALALAGALAGPSLRAQWGADDDHEIVTFLGSDGRVSLGELPALLAGTEVGRPGQAVRFRPAYYAVRLLEAACWGDSPAGWYAARIAMLAVTLALCGAVLARGIGPLPASLFLLYALTQRFWADIWCRLGPGETYAALGSALYLAGFQGVWRSGTGGRARDWLLLLAGSLLAIGSKENFLLLALPTVALLALLWARRRLGAVAIVASAAILVFSAFVGGSVALALSRAGGDVYGASVTPGYRLALLRDGAGLFFAGFSPWDLTAGLAVLAFAAYGLAGPTVLGRIGPVVARGAGAVLALAVLYATQYAFYRGAPRSGTRYDFPGALAAPLALLVVAHSAVALLRALGFDRGPLRGVEAGLVAGLALVVADRDPLLLRQGCMANAERTLAFTGRLGEVAARLREHPEMPLVVAAQGAGSYERVRGLPGFLARLGARNTLVLRMETSAAEDRPFERRLEDELRVLSRSGGDGYAPPPEALPPGCFALGIGREPGPPCAGLGTLPR
jgi:hypothetical protein